MRKVGEKERRWIKRETESGNADKGSEKAKKESRSYLPGTTSSILNGARLNGSFGSLSRCDRMVERSTDVREVGRMTGSSISVNIRGSRYIPRSQFFPQPP